jgi:L-lactate permease
MQSEIGTPEIVKGIIGLVVVVFFLFWWIATTEIRDEIRKWRAESEKRHDEIVDLLKKEKTRE